jgi:hypothetical protein
LTVLSLFAQCKMHYWWLVTWLDLTSQIWTSGTCRNSSVWINCMCGSRDNVLQKSPGTQSIVLLSLCPSLCSSLLPPYFPAFMLLNLPFSFFRPFLRSSPFTAPQPCPPPF